MIAIGSLLRGFSQYMVKAEEQEDRFHDGYIETEVLFKNGN